jgi:hypothetical protein
VNDPGARDADGARACFGVVHTTVPGDTLSLLLRGQIAGAYAPRCDMIGAAFRVLKQAARSLVK